MTAKTFDFKKFRSEKYQERTDTVELKNFGGTGEPVLWHVRGLTGQDMESVDMASEKNAGFSALIDVALKAIGGDERSKAKLAEELYGVSDSVPDSLVRKYVIFELGSIEPNKPGGRADVIKFATVYPVEFRMIISKILELTGLGQVVKKKQSQDIQN